MGLAKVRHGYISKEFLVNLFFLAVKNLSRKINLWTAIWCFEICIHHGMTKLSKLTSVLLYIFFCDENTCSLCESLYFGLLPMPLS